MVRLGDPNNHNFVSNRLKSEASDLEIVRICLDGGENEKAFRAGSMLPDITVVYYYKEGGKNYKLLHNWNFQQELTNEAITQDEKCLALGVALHLITDSVSHTQAVPTKIGETKIHNVLLHPLLEKKYDSETAIRHSEIINQTAHMLDAMYGPYGDRYIEMIEDAIGENIAFDVKKEVDNLAIALGSFYDEAFRPRVQDNSIFAVYVYLDKFTNFVHPYIGKWNIEDMDSFADKNVELTISTFNNWGSRYAISPHGFSELLEADEKAGRYFIFGLIALIIVSIWLPIHLMIKRKKFRYIFLSLMIIPIMLLVLTIIYIIL